MSKICMDKIIHPKQSQLDSQPAPSRFVECIDMFLNYCAVMLQKKSNEYTKDNKYPNFYRAAILQENTPVQALIGMMDKHVVSIHDLANREAEGEEIDIETWKEKISDNVNYLLLLWGILNIKDPKDWRYD